MSDAAAARVRARANVLRRRRRRRSGREHHQHLPDVRRRRREHDQHLTLTVVMPDKCVVDFRSCRLASTLLWRAIEREDALHWLSTLGGAYSNLGDGCKAFAEKAGVNALRQMRVAVSSGDDFVLSRCWLFLAMSYMQQQRLRASKSIVRWVFRRAQLSRRGGDAATLGRMCRGVWARLAHAWALRRMQRRRMADASKG